MVFNYGMELGTAMIVFLAVIIVWEAVWKLMAMWKAAKKGSVAWFIVLALLNTLGILSILYIYVFSEMKPTRTAEKRNKKRRKR